MPGVSQPSNQDFESTLASLAHAQLRDRAPALLDWLLGFQVVDQNEEQTHGVGVMGFGVGDQLLLIPVFFLNGELKMDMLYLKSQDIFVPLEDNWVTYLLNRRPFELGQAEHRTPQQLGVAEPDLTTFNDTPSGSRPSGWGLGKGASWVKGASAMFATSPKDKRYEKLLTLDQFLSKEAAYGPSVALASNMRSDPKVGDLFLKFYNVRQLLHMPSAAKRAADRPVPGYRPSPSKPRSPLLASMEKEGQEQKTGSVRILKRGEVFLRDLPEAEARKMLKYGAIVEDARESANQAYQIGFNDQIQNPDGSGRYELLLEPGETKTVFIGQGVHPVGEGVCRQSLVIDGDGNMGFWWAKDLWTTRAHSSTSEEDFDSWFGGLGDIGGMRPGSVYVLITPDRQCTVPFLLLNKVTLKDGTIELWTSPQVRPNYGDESSSGLPEGPRFGTRTSWEASPYEGEGCDEVYPQVDLGNDDWEKKRIARLKEQYLEGKRIVIHKKDSTEMVAVGKSLFVPNSCKAAKCSNVDKYQMWKGPKPGSLADVAAHVVKVGAAVPLELRRSGTMIYVNGRGPYSEGDVLCGLIKNSGLRENNARSVLSNVKERSAAWVLVKNAIGYAPPIPGPTLGYDADIGAMMQEPESEYMPVGIPEEQEFSPTDNRLLQDAAGTGQKEVFDTSAIAALIKTVDSDSVINQYISDLLLGLDRIGRILFMFYWHNEKFRDRWGRNELPELEDQLRNVFKGLGDLILFLKQRDVGENQSGDALEVELGRPD